MPIILFDMDGTTFRFHNVEFRQLFEKGYFRNLEPMENVINAVNDLQRMYMNGESDLEVYICSAYLADSPYALEEKNQCIDEYMPFIDKNHRLFVECGVDKTTVYPKLGSDVFVVEDYNANLNAAKEKGCTGIKLLNGINDRQRSWDGMRMGAWDKDMAKHILDFVRQIEDRNVERNQSLLSRMGERLLKATNFALEVNRRLWMLRDYVEPWDYGFGKREYEKMSPREKDFVQKNSKVTKFVVYTPEMYESHEKSSDYTALYVDSDFARKFVGDLADEKPVSYRGLDSFLCNYTPSDVSGLFEDANRAGAIQFACDAKDERIVYFEKTGNTLDEQFEKLKRSLQSYEHEKGESIDFGLYVGDIWDCELERLPDDLIEPDYPGETVGEYASSVGLARNDPLYMLDVAFGEDEIPPLSEEFVRRYADKYVFDWSYFGKKEFDVLKTALTVEQYRADGAMQDAWKVYDFGNVVVGDVLLQLDCSVKNGELKLDPQVYLGGIDDGALDQVMSNGYPYISWNDYGPDPKFNLPVMKDMNYEEFQENLKSEVTRFIKEVKERTYTVEGYGSNTTFNVADLACKSEGGWDSGLENSKRKDDIDLL